MLMLAFISELQVAYLATKSRPDAVVLQSQDDLLNRLDVVAMRARTPLISL